MWDRKVCACIAYASGALVVAIPFVRINQAGDGFRSSLLLTVVMIVCLAVEVFLVLYSSQVIEEAFNLIGDNAGELTKALQASIPENASKGVDGGSS